MTFFKITTKGEKNQKPQYYLEIHAIKDNSLKTLKLFGVLPSK